MTLDKVRILHLIATNFVGGPEKQILQHALSASSSSLEIWLGSFRDFPARPEFLERAERMGLPTVEFSSGRFGPRTVIELARTLREKKISLICTHGYKANLLGWAASRLIGCPQIAFARGWTGENWRIKMYERLDRLVLRWTDWVVCVSRPLGVEIAKRRPGRTQPKLIPNCALFPFRNVVLPLDRQPVRESLGLPNDGFYVCAAGRLSPEKGHHYLLQAVASITERIPRLLLVVLGEGRERANLETQATELGIRKHVLFTGFKKDIRPWIQACDLLVNPSLTEGMPNVVLEAMALGTPVVATAVGGVPDLIQNGDSGVLVPPANPVILADAVYQLFTNPAAALHLAQSAQVQLQEYSPAEQCQQLLSLYSKVLQGKETQATMESKILPAQTTGRRSEFLDSAATKSLHSAAEL